MLYKQDFSFDSSPYVTGINSNKDPKHNFKYIIIIDQYTMNSSLKMSKQSKDTIRNVYFINIHVDILL